MKYPRWLLGMGLVLSAVAAAEGPTIESLRDLERATKSCQRNFTSGGVASQDGFEACLRASLDEYYQAIVKKAWGTPRTPLLEGSAPPPSPTPLAVVDRAKEEGRAREQFKRLVKSARCQRCHVSMDASQFTLQQMHSVLNTPSHKEHLGPSEFELLRNLGGLLN